MDNINEIKALTDSFKSYRDVLVPLQESLRLMVDSYDVMKDDLSRLEQAFGGETKSQLNKIYETLSAQAKNSTDLSSRIGQFVAESDRYAQTVNDIAERFKAIETRLENINAIEKNAENQLRRLDEIINEKKLNYNIKDLQKALENYNKNVEKVSEFINKDVANVLQENGKKINAIKQSNDAVTELLATQGRTVNELVETTKATNEFLRKSVEKEDVNEEYIFSVLDKWATARKVKIKK